MLQISPCLQARIQNYQPNNNVVQQNAVAPLKSGVADTVVKNNVKSNKNIGKYVAIGLAISAAVVGAVLLLKKGNAQLQIKKMINGARATFADVLKFKSKAIATHDEAQALAQDVQKRAELLRQEVTDLFNCSGMKDGTQLAEIIKEGEILRMTERTAQGEVSRVSEFSLDKVLKSIQEHVGDKTNEYNYDENGILRRCALGVKRFAGGIIKTDKLLHFTNPEITGKPSVLTRYFEKLEQHGEENFKAAKRLEMSEVYEDICYEEGFEGKGLDVIRLGSFKSSKRIEFSDLGIEYSEGHIQHSRGHYDTRKSLAFKDNNVIKRYSLNNHNEGLRKATSAKRLEFRNGEPSYYIEGYQSDRALSVGKKVFGHDDDGNWVIIKADKHEAQASFSRIKFLFLE